MSKIAKQKAVILDSLQFKMARKRDIQLDAIKVASRSDDQANSACNILKAIYYNFGWLVQRTLVAYNTKTSDSQYDITFTDSEKNRLSDIIYNMFSYSKEYKLDAGESELLEPIKKYADMVKISIYTVLSSVGVNSLKPKYNMNMDYVISNIEGMKEMISDLLSGYNPYNQIHNN
ncbi:hypothetical protein HOU90_gp081 [Lactobacillus phage Lpa804]|uniref:Uncharacterized protein n=1 Tax=Lactobacillus phage Lpa804 TaxID=2059850 RepID=A0A3S6QAF3_9CAUD|nr:hypothetical protein HOU90_gp081 [Lactobacillus phage Lpa804]AUG84731.1 hypothetical protein Lpa804_155 [Lactobacillus phage Lpa804]